jgi:DnaJ-domain-containing protein 1
MDSFTRFEFPWQPWIDPEVLQARFHELSSRHHPDRFQSTEEKKAAEKLFSEINSAHQTLKSESARLACLIELETGSKAGTVQEIPPEAMEFFNDVAKISRGLEKFFAEEKPADSPMLNVHHFERALEWTEIVREMRGRIQEQINKLRAELKEMNAPWQTAPPATGHSSSQARLNALPMARLRAIASAMAFLEKWNAQLSEKLARLAQLT